MTMTFEQLKQFLLSGESTIATIGTAQGYKASAEKIDGKETGLQIVKATGGKVTRKIQETILLNGFQSLAVRKGLTEFGSDAVIFLGETVEETGEFLLSPSTILEKLIDLKVQPKQLVALVSRYTKAIDNEMILTDLQAVELLQAVCASEMATATAVEKVRETDKATAQTSVDKFNERVQAERATQLNALSKSATA